MLSLVSVHYSLAMGINVTLFYKSTDDNSVNLRQDVSLSTISKNILFIHLLLVVSRDTP